MTLTPKQEAAARKYIECGSKTEAYRLAGYKTSGMKPETLHRTAHELFDNPKVAARVTALQAATLKRHEVTVDRVIQEYAKLGFANMLDYITVDKKDGGAFVDLSALTRDQAAAIQELVIDHMPARPVEGEDGEEIKVAVLKTRFKLADKKGALDSLGKHLGMFKDLSEHTGKDGAPLFPDDPIDKIDLARRLLHLVKEAASETKPNGDATKPA